MIAAPPDRTRRERWVYKMARHVVSVYHHDSRVMHGAFDMVPRMGGLCSVTPLEMSPRTGGLCSVTPLALHPPCGRTCARDPRGEGILSQTYTVAIHGCRRHTFSHAAMNHPSAAFCASIPSPSVFWLDCHGRLFESARASRGVTEHKPPVLGVIPSGEHEHKRPLRILHAGCTTTGPCTSHTSYRITPSTGMMP